MKSILLTLIISGLISLISCSENTTTDKENAVLTAKYIAADEHAAAISVDIVNANNDFTARIFKAMAAVEPGKNMMLSPLSISIAISMTLNGASGDNLLEMKKILGFTDMELDSVNQQFSHLVASLVSADKDLILASANSIWMDLTFKPLVNDAFLNALSTYFDAEPVALDFSVPENVNIINSWVSENTYGKIEKILDELNPDAVMYLINAIYFKAAWTTTFDAESTYDGTFTLSGGDEKTVKLMTFKENREFKFFSSEEGATNGYTAVRLPYGRDKFAFYGFIPDSGTVDEFINHMADSGLDSFFTNLTAGEIKLVLPEFKFEYNKSLTDILKSLGMNKAFQPGGLLNLTQVGNDLAITDVKHKTYIEVNEDGTEAAGVTSVEIGPTSIMLDSFLGIKPFVFIIRDDRSGTILFIGKVEDPSL